MICFIIALMNKAVAKDWESVQWNFNRTLHSIFNQTDDKFRVYVGYTDKPDLYDNYDNRLKMIPCGTHTPVERIEKLRDRGWKLSVCANAIYNDYDELAFKEGGIFVFPVDADDLVNRNIAAFVNAHPTANGFKSRKSYLYKGRKYLGKPYLEITPYFGGSMNIMKLYKEDLIDEMPDVKYCFDYETASDLHEKCPVRWTDQEVEGLFSALGRPFSYLPFRSTIYMLGTGDNLSNGDPNLIKKTQNKKTFHPIAFIRRVMPFNKVWITASIERDFGIKNDYK